jgi:NADH-quinone oxidoreductase subunit M
MVGHGLSVSLLFLLSTSIHQRTRTFDMEEMGGLARKAPVLAAFFAAATFASIGLPGFANFWGELSIFVALWRFSPGFTALAVLGIVISAVYGLRAVAKVFFGEPTGAFTRVTERHPVSDMGWGERLPALVLLSALLLIGFWPKSVTSAIDAALAQAPVQMQGKN